MAAVALGQRGRRRERLALWLALTAGFGVEIAGKEWVAQVRYTETERVFDLFTLPRSFPSGHGLRSVLLAAAVCALWPSLRGWAVAWAVLMLVMIEVTGMHVPTDVLGGRLAGLVLLSAAHVVPSSPAFAAGSTRDETARGRPPSPAGSRSRTANRDDSA